MDLSAPRSPITEDTPDYRLRYKRAMDEWRDGTKEQAYLAYRNSPEYDNTDKYIRYLEGTQWNANRARYKSKFVENKIELTRREKLALLTDTKPVMDVTTEITAYRDVADAVGGTIRKEWERQREADTLIDVVDIAMLHGTGFVRLGGTSEGGGKMTSLALGPDNVMPIQPSKRSIQDSVAILYRTWKPIGYFKKVFPFNSDHIENQAKYWESKVSDRFIRPAHIPEYTWSQMSPQFRKMVGGKISQDAASQGGKYYGAIELEEYYYDDQSINESTKNVVVKDPYLPQGLHNWWYVVKPGQRLYPRKRLVIYAGDRLMYDGPNPFWHGLYPFEDLKLNPVPWSYYGFSSYRSLVPLQDAINDIPAGVLDMTKRVLNPTIISKMNVTSEAAWREYLSDMPGARLRVNQNVNIATDIGYGPTPVIPNFVGEIYHSTLTEFDKMAGTLDPAALMQKKQMPSGETLDQMRDSLQTATRREERYIESFLQRCGTQKVSNVIQFYSAIKRLDLLGAEGLTDSDFLPSAGKMHPAQMTDGSISKGRAEDFKKLFALNIEPGSTHSGADDRKKQLAAVQASQGLISRREYFRQMGYSDEHAKQMMDEMAQEAQVMSQIESQGRTLRSSGAKDGAAASL